MIEALIWPGGEHAFRLGIAELRALQDKCDAGPGHVAERLMGSHGGWRVDDIVQPLRLGLVGGGMGQPEAGTLVLKVFEESGPAELRAVAYSVLMASILGPPEDQPGDGQPGDDGPGESGAGETVPDESLSLAENSTSQSSTVPAP